MWCDDIMFCDRRIKCSIYYFFGIPYLHIGKLNDVKAKKWNLWEEVKSVRRGGWMMMVRSWEKGEKWDVIKFFDETEKWKTSERNERMKWKSERKREWKGRKNGWSLESGCYYNDHWRRNDFKWWREGDSSGPLHHMSPWYFIQFHSFSLILSHTLIVTKRRLKGWTK